jgi:hypothetical protein
MNISKHKIKIKSINLDKNNFIIQSENNQTFISKIIKGSVDFKIYNENKEELNLSNLEIGDLIQIYEITDLKQEENNDVDKLLILLDQNNNFKKPKQKNSIINKIIIKNKYVFNSDSSENYDLLEN